MVKKGEGRSPRKGSASAAAPSAEEPLGHLIPIEAAEALRLQAGLAAGEGPPPENVRAALDVYVRQFDWWYGKQWHTILPDYVKRIVRRINPFVRRAQHGDCSSHALAEAVVGDWDSRNFVTAGGQALEALAIAIGKNCQKAIAEGVDVQRTEPADPSKLHLYTVKSGAVTRNTDIVSKMKINLRKAEKLARQSPGIGTVRLNYATCVGTLATTLADGVYRPSSAQFWSEVMELPEDKAVRLLWTVTESAAQWIRWPERNRRALVEEVAAYVGTAEDPERVDWEFLVRVVTQPPTAYKAEHVRRHGLAVARKKAILEEPG